MSAHFPAELEALIKQGEGPRACEEGEKTICLTMIVKNEIKVLKRCFDSVLPIIDTFSICDTGSTDGTPEFIESSFKEKGMTGKVMDQ